MRQLSVSWGNVEYFDPDMVLEAKDTGYEVLLVFKDGKVLSIGVNTLKVDPMRSFHKLCIEEEARPNSLTVGASMAKGEDNYSAMSLSIQIGRYHYYQHSFVDAVPDLDANRICMMTMYNKEEQYGSESC